MSLLIDRTTLDVAAFALQSGVVYLILENQENLAAMEQWGREGWFESIDHISSGYGTLRHSSFRNPTSNNKFLDISYKI